MIVLSHPTGNNFVRNALRVLQQNSLLHSFHTTVGVSQDDAIVNRLPGTLARELQRRAYDLPPDLIHGHPVREAVRLLAPSLRARSLTKHETGWASVDAIYQDLDRRVSDFLLRNKPDASITASYCYEDGAEQTFKAAHQIGRKNIYELPIAYWQTSRTLLEEQKQIWPEWANTLVGTEDSPEKLERKTTEVNLADAIICPSDFVLRSIPDTVRSKIPCVVAPFGTPDSSTVPVERSHKNLRVLFAGSMTQRKGLADLFAAMKMLSTESVELVVFGSPIEEMSFYKRQLPDFRWEQPRPHGEVLILMQQCDVLVLPSIVEGRALVQQEAMSCGLPIVITPNTGGEDLVDEGKTGFVVPTNAPEKIAEKIEWFATHRGELDTMRSAAADRAASVTWANYRQQILELVSLVAKK